MLAKQIGQNLHTLTETGKRLYSKIGFLLSKNTLFEFLFVLLHPEVALLSRVRQISLNKFHLLLFQQTVYDDAVGLVYLRGLYRGKVNLCGHL